MSHPSKSGQASAETVNLLGMVSMEQISKARSLQQRGGADGKRLSLPDALLEIGAITEAQRDLLKPNIREHDPDKLKALGPYRLIEPIGKGGMGVVYLAEDTLLARKVAVKVLHEKYAEDPQFIERFQREAKVAGSLNHENICTAFLVGEDQGYHYYVMEYCEGESLGERLDHDAQLPLHEAMDVIIQTAQGLVYAHSKGVIHRDIKPDNLLITNEGVVKILDLGLSKLINNGKKTSYLTRHRMAVGTPDYISPEQVQCSKNVDGRADIYSLGATFYHLVTGFPPYDAPSTREIVLQHLNRKVPNPQDMNKNLPDGVVHVIARMMAKDPNDRYTNGQALLEDLALIRHRRSPRSQALAWDKSNVAMPGALKDKAVAMRKKNSAEARHPAVKIKKARGLTAREGPPTRDRMDAWPRRAPRVGTSAARMFDQEELTPVEDKKLGIIGVNMAIGAALVVGLGLLVYGGSGDAWIAPHDIPDVKSTDSERNERTGSVGIHAHPEKSDRLLKIGSPSRLIAESPLQNQAPTPFKPPPDQQAATAKGAAIKTDSNQGKEKGKVSVSPPENPSESTTASMPLEEAERKWTALFAAFNQGVEKHDFESIHRAIQETARKWPHAVLADRARALTDLAATLEQRAQEREQAWLALRNGRERTLQAGDGLWTGVIQSVKGDEIEMVLKRGDANDPTVRVRRFKIKELTAECRAELSGHARPATPDAWMAHAVESMAWDDLREMNLALGEAGQHPLQTPYLKRMEVLQEHALESEARQFWEQQLSPLASRKEHSALEAATALEKLALFRNRYGKTKMILSVALKLIDFEMDLKQGRKQAPNTGAKANGGDEGVR